MLNVTNEVFFFVSFSALQKKRGETFLEYIRQHNKIRWSDDVWNFFHTWSKIGTRFPLSFSTISTMEGLLFRSASTHFSPIRMHAFTCCRPFESSDGYLCIICSFVFQFWCTCRVGFNPYWECINWIHGNILKADVSNFQSSSNAVLHW